MNPSQPTTAQLSDKRSDAIDARWQELLPWCILSAKKTSDPADTLHMLKSRHRARCIELFANRIPWDTIRPHDLDDPREGDEFFKKSLKEAIERRRSRMGRVKGQSRCQPHAK